MPDKLVALVTGASRGIGQATAIELARRDIHVVLLARTQGGLEETDDIIRAAGGQATLLPQDLAEFDAVDMLGPSLHARFGRLDILVHAAAALGKLTPVGHIMIKDWDAAMAVNLGATLRLIRTCDPLLRAAPAGRAVFLTDSRATSPWAYWATYGARQSCDGAPGENLVPRGPNDQPSCHLVRPRSRRHPATRCSLPGRRPGRAPNPGRSRARNSRALFFGNR